MAYRPVRSQRKRDFAEDSSLSVYAGGWGLGLVVEVGSTMGQSVASTVCPRNRHAEMPLMSGPTLQEGTGQ